MITKKSNIDKIEDGVAHISAKADARIESGCDPIQADWNEALIMYPKKRQSSPMGRIAFEVYVHRKQPLTGHVE